jgi:hypothetical protein
MREAEPPVQNVHLDILNKTDGCAMVGGVRLVAVASCVQRVLSPHDDFSTYLKKVEGNPTGKKRWATE